MGAENTSHMAQVLVRDRKDGGTATPWFAVGTTGRYSERAVAKLFLNKPGDGLSG